MSNNIFAYRTYLLALAVGFMVLPSSGSWADTRFGESGAAGAPGQDGRQGFTEAPVQINADGTSQTYNLRGGDGEDGGGD